jgi:hypothetical protein
VARKYYEETPDVEKSGPGVVAVMRAAAKSKYQFFKGQFLRYTAIANPKLGDEFLEEVSVSYLHPCLLFLNHN